MELTINIQATELANAIQSLADAFGAKRQEVQAPPLTVAAQQLQSQVNPSTLAPQQPVQRQIPAAVPTAPIQQASVQQAPAPQQPTTVPTSAPTYTMDQLAVASTQLMDAGKQPQLLQLLASFGVQALMQLPKEQYGAFATKLRELGANL